MVIVRYQSFPANAVLTHRFESVARPPLRCDGTRAGIKRGSPPLRIFPALFNLCRPLVGWSFRSLHHLRQKSRSIFAVSFRPEQPKGE